MFKVECPGCNAPYQVDERRVPATGLKMRCPKCGTSFKVDAPAETREPSLGAPPGDAPAPPPPPRRLGRDSPLKSTMLGVPPPGAGGPAGQRARTGDAAGPPARSLSGAYDEVDLPTVGGRATAPEPARPVAPPEADLPAPVASRADRADLPAAAPPRPRPRAPEPPPPVRLAPPPAPSRARAVEPAPDIADVDLPAALSMKFKAPQSAAEADLPAVGRAPKQQSPAASSSSTRETEPEPVIPDLPSVGFVRPQPGFGEVDLPSTLQGRSPPPPSAREFTLDLEADLPSAAEIPGLPSPAAGLPALSAELPSPGGELPNPFAALPTPAAGLPSPAAGLPSPSVGLPSPAAGLPRVVAPALPTPAAGLPRAGSGLSLASEDFSAVPPLAETPPRPPGASGQHRAVAAGGLSSPPLRLAEPRDTFGELELPEGGPAAPAAAEPELEADFSASSMGRPQVVRQAGGGVAYGEVNLDGADVLPPPERSAPVAIAAATATADDMEFGAIPQEAPKPSTRLQAPGVVRPAAAAAVAVATREVADAPRRQPGKRRTGRVVALVIALVAIGGGALAMVPELGPFGAYWLSDRLKGGEHRQLVSSTVSAARAELASDTYPAAQQALRVVEQARSRAKRVDALAAYTAFVAYARELRFGTDPELRARGQVLLEELKDVTGDPHVDLARAAQAIVSGQLTRARQQLDTLAQSDAKDIDGLVLRGELELKAKEPAAALAAWKQATQVAKSPRTTFGLARAHDASGNAAEALKVARELVQANAKHAGGRILVARLTLREAEAEAVRALEAVVADAASASPEEIVTAQTLLGEIHLRRWRVSRAETAYSEALKINPKNARALIGLGDALYRAGRFSEALARFEAAVQADPDDISAKVGVAKTKLALEQQQEAGAMLKALLEAHPNSMRVAYWYGKVLEAGGSRKDAEKAYRTAIAQGQDDPHVVDAYIALSQLLNQEGRRAEAQKTLADARVTLKDSSSIHLGLGELALSEGRHADAIKEFRAALQGEPGDLTAKFRLGVALRRNRSFDEAQKLFDDVAVVDRDYPGLALERGLLYEAAGRAEEALVAYEAALARAPNDPDLMLRVGCGKIAAGRARQAQDLLRKVLAMRPNSAETNHCLGRALLIEGKSLAEALRILERATELDGNRAEYWLHVGWAANEAGRVAKAEEALDKALAMDQSLADAYWQRGVLRGRQGAVKDAVKDLLRALELRPTRHEAHAALADAYDELGLETEALQEWEKAVAAEPENALWAFRYGKLLSTNRRQEPARAQLQRAIELGERMDPKPLWLAEAHLQMARAIGTRPEAVKHWQAFLSSGSRDSAYRDEAKETLRKLGKPWDGD